MATNEAGNGQAGGTAAQATSQETTPPIDFTTFVLSLGQTALVQLGLAAGPDGQKQAPEPAAARETIDILGMLREKTRGNLTAEETRFLDALLHDLRMQYVQAAKK